MFTLGRATITRVEETNVPSYPLRQVFPELSEAELAEHLPWLAPHHYDADKGLIRLSVHSWLIQIDGKKILIDACCGNNKVKPGRPFWSNLNEPWLERLAAAGARPRRDRHGDVHASASRSCRLEHAAARRQMGADFPQCALRLLQAGRRLFLQDRRRSERRPGGNGHVPRMRRSDPGARPRRSGERRALPAQ